MGPQRKGGVSGRQVVHVKGFTAGGLFAVEIAPVPGGGPNLIRPGLLGLLCFDAWFGLLSYRATWIVVRARVSLSRSQAGDAQKHRQSVSNRSSHSVHLA